MQFSMAPPGVCVLDNDIEIHNMGIIAVPDVKLVNWTLFACWTCARQGFGGDVHDFGDQEHQMGPVAAP